MQQLRPDVQPATFGCTWLQIVSRERGIRGPDQLARSGSGREIDNHASIPADLGMSATWSIIDAPDSGGLKPLARGRVGRCPSVSRWSAQPVEEGTREFWAVGARKTDRVRRHSPDGYSVGPSGAADRACRWFQCTLVGWKSAIATAHPPRSDGRAGRRFASDACPCLGSRKTSFVEMRTDPAAVGRVADHQVVETRLWNEAEIAHQRVAGFHRQFGPPDENRPGSRLPGREPPIASPCLRTRRDSLVVEARDRTSGNARVAPATSPRTWRSPPRRDAGIIGRRGGWPRRQSAALPQGSQHGRGDHRVPGS